MKNSKLLIFTGAGFSRSVSPDYLTTEELYKKLNFEGEDYQDVLQYFNTYISHRQNNNLDSYIEDNGSSIDAEILARELYNFQMQLDSLPKILSVTNTNMIGVKVYESTGAVWLDVGDVLELKSSIQKIIDKINLELFSKLNDIKPQKDELLHIHFLLDSIKNLKIPFNIFSTNYDLLFDYILKESSRHYVEETVINIDKLINNNESCSYIPLKGMLDWNKNGEEIFKGYTSEGLSISTSVSLGLESQDNKFLSEYPYKELYEKFSQDLSQAEILLFIGFSFRDQHINKLIDQYSHKYKKVIIVDKTDNQSKQEKFKEHVFQKILSKFYHKDNIEFIHNGFNMENVKVIMDYIKS